MKTTRMVIGIISIVLFVIVSFQSCAVGVGEALVGSEEGSGSIGFLLSVCMLVAGIVAICTRKGVKGAFVCAGFWGVGGLLGLLGYGSYSDLAVWSVVSLAFAVVFLFAGIRAKKEYREQAEQSQEQTKF